MKRLLTVAAVLSAVLVAFNAPARADVSDIRFTDSGLEAKIGGGSLKYGETYGATTPDAEAGWMPSFGFSADLLTNTKKYTWLSDLYMNLDFNATTGNVQYNGHFNDPANTPLSTTNHASIYSLDGQIGHAFPIGNSVMLTPMIDLGYRYWARQISGGSLHFEEDYQQGEAMAGLLTQYSPFSKWVFSFRGLFGTTFGAHMTNNLIVTNIVTSQNYRFTYDLDPRWVGEAVAKAGYTFSKHFEATTTFSFKAFGYGRSPTQVDSSFEPDSYTHEMRAMVGLAYHL